MRSEAPLELGVGAAQRRLGVELQMPAQIHDGEQQVTELVRHCATVGRAGSACRIQLRQLLGDLVAYARGVRPVEADACGAAAEFSLRATAPAAPAAPPPAPRDHRPAAGPHGARSSAFCASHSRGNCSRREWREPAKHVRMAAHELLVDRRGDIREVEPAPLLGHPRVEHHLEQQVARARRAAAAGRRARWRRPPRRPPRWCRARWWRRSARDPTGSPAAGRAGAP